MDKILKLYKINKKMLMCMLIMTIIGVISGSVFYYVLSSTDKTTVSQSVIEFFDNIQNNQIDYGNSLKTGLITNLVYIFVIWLLGISIIGLPLILVLYFFKTFTLGFTLISIISNYAFKGVLYSFIYIFPHNVINILSFAFLSVYAIICSFNTTSSFFKKEAVDFKPIISKYRYILIITILIVILSSLYQTFVMPTIIKVVLNLLK